ncbi:patatin-like phospholipase family protein [Demetria terragena]|uniref:patatin-like phospholipase family protein n=1 Tax=Demetria terragena TaxID=63959 RepID=UPI0003754E8A|nr:patatin-like phospholipase family protein [Demetria terragena]
MTPLRPVTAFVLGGGGILGATHVGAIRALLDDGIVPDMVLGTSIGAVNGAFVAADPTQAGLQRLHALWDELAAAAPWRDPLLRAPNRPRTPRATRPRRGRSHLLRPGPFLHLLDTHLPVERIEQMPVPFQCVAASIENASARWFSSGLAAPAILASCAVPGLFPSIEIDGEHYLDGGLVHSIPISRALTLGATRVFVVHVGRVEQPLKPPRWPWEAAQVAFEIARRHRYVEEMAALPKDVEVHVMPSGVDDAPMMSLLHRNPRYIARRIESAHKAGQDYLAQALGTSGGPP